MADVYDRLADELNEEFQNYGVDMIDVVEYLTTRGILDYDILKEVFSDDEEEE